MSGTTTVANTSGQISDSNPLQTTSTPGTAATSLGKAEDAVHTSGDVGVMLLAVRKDTPVALAADGDYIPVLVDANGKIWTLASSPIRTYTKAASTAASSGDQTLVAAPSAGNHLVVKDIVVQNESSTETTIILKNGATAEWRAKLAANAAFALSFAEGEEWRLTTATALVLNLSGANSHGYSIRYRIEAD